MVFGGSNSVQACSPRAAQVQGVACSGELPKDGSLGCEPPGLRDGQEEQEERGALLPVSCCISEQQLDDLEDILSEPQPSTRPRAPDPWESHEEVLLLGDRPWEELEKDAWLRNMKKVGVDLGLSLVGPGAIGTVLGAATGAAAGTVLLGPGGMMVGAVYGAKGGATLGVAGAAVAGATNELVKPEGCLRDCCTDKDAPPSPEKSAGISRTSRGAEKNLERRTFSGSGGAESGSQGKGALSSSGKPASQSIEGQGWWPWSQRRQSRSQQGPVKLTIAVIGESAVRVELTVAGQGNKVVCGTGGPSSSDKPASPSVEGQAGWWPWSQRRQSLSQQGPVKLTIAVIGERSDSVLVRVELAVAAPHSNGQSGVIEPGTGGRNKGETSLGAAENKGGAAVAEGASDPLLSPLGLEPMEARNKDVAASPRASDSRAQPQPQAGPWPPGWWSWQQPSSKLQRPDGAVSSTSARPADQQGPKASGGTGGDALVSVKLAVAAEGPQKQQLVSVEIVPLAVSAPDAQGIDIPVAPSSGGSLFGDWPWYQKPQTKAQLPPTEQPGASPTSPASSSQPGKEEGGGRNDDVPGTDAASKAAPAKEERKGLPWLQVWDSSSTAKSLEKVPAKPGEFLLEACDELGGPVDGSEGPVVRSTASQAAEQQSSMVPSPSWSLPWTPRQRPERETICNPPQMPAEATQTGRRSSAEATMPAEVPCSSKDQENGGKAVDSDHLRLSSSAPGEKNARWMRLPFVSSSPPSSVPILPSAASWLQSSRNELREGSIPDVGRNGSKGDAVAAANAAAEVSLTAGWGVLQKLLAMGSGFGPAAPLASDISNKDKPGRSHEDITAKLKWRSVARGQVVEALLGRAVDRLMDELVSELEDLEQAAE